VVLVKERICGGAFDRMSGSRKFSELYESDTLQLCRRGDSRSIT
jgi:hypothetical protein